MGPNEASSLRDPLLKDSDSVALDVEQANPNPENKIRRIVFRIQGIQCSSCAVSIETVVGRLKGVESISISPLEGQAVVRYIPDVISLKMIRDAIEGLDYHVDEFPEQEIAVCSLRIKGMMCTSCAESIEKALLMAEGVKRAVVGISLEEAKIYFDPGITNSQRLLDVVEDAGFGADLISSGDDTNKVHLKLEGLLSPDDAAAVQLSLEAHVGVNNVQMDVAEQKVAICYNPDITGSRSLIQCVQEAGRSPNQYRATLYSPPRRREAERQHEIRLYRYQFLLSCLFSVPVFIFSMVLPMLPPYGNWLDEKLHCNLTIGMLLRWILCSPVQFIIGWRFYVGSYHALRRGSSNMDVLIALGTNAAYFYSVYVVLKALASDSFMGEDSFETSSMLISFILLGKYLEAVAKGKTSDALAKLTGLAPDTASLLSLGEDGNVISETTINTQLLQRNDVIKIVPGAKIPVDGVVIEGQSRVNESMITGEPRPIAKRPGDQVIGGTVNENGCIFVRATRVGSDTALSQIVQLVEAAQLARAPVQKLADKIAKFFVPSVVVVAFITWLGWFVFGEAQLYPRSWVPDGMDRFELALQFGISVLVIACPCALGLATPTAVMVATGKGASLGVLMKGGDALERAHKVKTVVFDKTGTLTVGKPSVVNTLLLSETPLQELCDLAAAAEANSEHPIARAIVEHARKLHQMHGTDAVQADAKDFEVHVGAGVRASIGGRVVLVGNKRLMLAFGVPISPSAERILSETETLARTCVMVAIDGVIHGAFSVSDPLKPEASRVVSYLNSMGISSVMVTGDNWATANAIAKEAGIGTVFAESDPAGKAEIIKGLQGKGLVVAMVGDGINDSPALAAADVGMAIGAGADVAIEAADVVLVRSDLGDVATAIHLSRKAMSKIRLNYVWALGYNVLGVPVAAGALFPLAGVRLPPWLAGACMAASSLSVVCSSLLLQYYRKPLQCQHIETQAVGDSNLV